jgi:hypothetical protein
MRLMDFFSRKPGVDARLFGPWSRIDSEGETDRYVNVELEFLEDGTLRRAMYDGVAWRVVELSYRIDGPVVASRHASSATENRLGFALENDNLLRLDAPTNCTWYERGTRRQDAAIQVPLAAAARAT